MEIISFSGDSTGRFDQDLELFKFWSRIQIQINHGLLPACQLAASQITPALGQITEDNRLQCGLVDRFNRQDFFQVINH